MAIFYYFSKALNLIRDDLKRTANFESLCEIKNAARKPHFPKQTTNQ